MVASGTSTIVALGNAAASSFAHFMPKWRSRMPHAQTAAPCRAGQEQRHEGGGMEVLDSGAARQDQTCDTGVIALRG